MHAGKRFQRQLIALAAGTACLSLPATVEAQSRWFNFSKKECPPPAVVPCPPPPPAPIPAAPTETGKQPTTPQAEQPTTPPPRPDTTPQTPEGQDRQDPSLSGAQASAVGGDTVALATPTMFGDQLAIPALAFARRQNPQFPPRPGQAAVTSAVAVPSVRSFKISENESPQPRDRVYFGYNYFDNINASVNQRLGTGVRDLKVNRETLGFEKTLFGPDLSFGMRIPLNTLSAESVTPGIGGTNTAMGDLSMVGKYAFWKNEETGSLMSTGLALTVPTGSDSFAGSNAIQSFHSTILQPYLGYIWNAERFYVHGFLAIDVPTDSNDVTLLHNDIGLGYYLYHQRGDDRILTAIIPTFEVHINNPMNHRGALNVADLAGTPDWVSLTSGATFELNHRSALAVGFNVPVTGPKPYDYEVLVQFNWRFGRSVRSGNGANVIGN